MTYEMQCIYNRTVLDRDCIIKILQSLGNQFVVNFCVDVGCGPGASTKILSRCFPNAKLVLKTLCYNNPILKV